MGKKLWHKKPRFLISLFRPFLIFFQVYVFKNRPEKSLEVWSAENKLEYISLFYDECYNEAILFQFFDSKFI